MAEIPSAPVERLIRKAGAQRVIVFMSTKPFGACLVVALLFLAFSAIASAENVVSSTSTQIVRCTEITSPGYYQLAVDLYGSHGYDDWCIKITANDVVLDGNEHSITRGGGVFGGRGIFIENANNVTVKNSKSQTLLGVSPLA